MKINNLNGILHEPCVCGSWLNHWKKFSGQPLAYCSERSCTKTDLVGAHVQRLGSKELYIVPLCTEHYKDVGELELIDDIKLVPANKATTCEKITPRNFFGP